MPYERSLLLILLVFLSLCLGSSSVSLVQCQDPASALDRSSSSPPMADSPGLAAIGSDPFDFNISVAPIIRTILPGGSTSFLIHLHHLSGLPQELFVGCNQLFAGASVSFSSHYVTPSGSSIMTLHTIASVPAGNYTIGIQASRGGFTRSTTVEVIIALEPIQFAVAATPDARTIKQGETAEYSITLTTIKGPQRQVDLSLIGLPLGSTAGFKPSSITPGQETTMKVTTSPLTSTGTYHLTIMATGGGTTSIDTISLTVTEADPATRNLGTWKGTLDGYWETTIPKAETPDGYIIPETRSGYYTIDLTLRIDQDDYGQPKISGGLRMKIEQPSRVIHLPGYTAGMSFDPSEFEGEIKGKLITSNQIELYWIDPPNTTRTYWDRHQDGELDSQSRERPWPNRLVEGLNPIDIAIEQDGVTVRLSSHHITDWEVTPGFYGTNTWRASGSVHKAWTQLVGTYGEVEIERNGGHPNLTEPLLQAGDIIRTGKNSHARIRMPDFDVLMAENTELEVVEAQSVAPSNNDIASIAIKEKEEFSWKYELGSPSYLAWITDGKDNERPIPFGKGRSKGSAFVSNVLYKAGFPVPFHHLDGDPSKPRTDDPARPDELFDTSRYTDILPVVKDQGAPVLYDNIRPGDLVVMETRVSIVTKVSATSAEIVHYSPHLNRIEYESGQIPTYGVIRRPTISMGYPDLDGNRSLVFSLKEGMIKLFNATAELTDTILAPVYTPKESKLYTKSVELYTGFVDLYTKFVGLMTRPKDRISWGVFRKAPSNKFKAITVTPVMGVRGTDLIVMVRPDGSCIVQLLHGSARMSIDDGSMAKFLFPGERAVFGPDKTLLETSRLDWQTLDRWWEVEPGPTGLLSVYSTPPGCNVHVDGKPVGKTPMEIQVTAGSHLVKVEGEGHESWSDIINVVESQGTMVGFELTPIEAQEVPATFTIFVEDDAFNVTIRSNSIISGLGFDKAQDYIHFLDSGLEGTMGDYSITVPLALLQPGYLITADDEMVESTITTDEATSTISFSHPLGAQTTIGIKGSYPVSQSTLIHLLLLAAAIPTLIRRHIQPSDRKALIPLQVQVDTGACEPFPTSQLT